MRNHRIARIFCLLAVLFTALSARAQIVSRGVPDNDIFAGALTLVPGTSVKIPDPAAATEDPGDPSPCGVLAHNSIWFTFTPDRLGVLYLSTAGTQLIHPVESAVNTALGVYTGAAPASLTQVGCDGYSGANESEMEFQFTAGETYHILLSTINNANYTPQSFYKLTSRILYLTLGPANSHFEDPLTAADWTLKNGTGDDRACSDPVYVPITAPCAFKFTGGAGENSKLVQSYTIPAGYRFRKKGMIAMYVGFRGMDTASIGNAKITATLVYSNGTPSNKITLNLSGIAASGYAFANGFAFLAHASLSKIKLKVSHKSTAGVLMLDWFNMEYSAGAIVRTSGVPPVPQVARNKSF